MTEYEFALFLHLLGVVVMASGITVAAAAHAVARRLSAPSEVAAVLALARVGVLLAGPGTLLVVGAGAWLTSVLALGDAGWLHAAIAVLVVALALGALGGQTPKRARLRAQEDTAAGVGVVTPELRALLDDRRSTVLNHGSAVLMLVVLALMVFKP